MKKGLLLVALVGALFTLARPAVAHASNASTTAYGTIVTNDDPPPWSLPPLHPSDDPPPWFLPPTV